MAPKSQQSETDADFWTCNIDRKGRNVRLITGFLALGIAAWLWWSKGEAFWSIGLLTAGALALYEGLRGWCVLRAFGMRTPL